MARLVVLPTAVFVLGALALTGCTTNGPDSDSAAKPVATSAKAAQVAAQQKTAADPLASLARRDFNSALLTSAQATAMTPEMNRPKLTGPEGQFVGAGGTCRALASFLNSSGVLSSVDANTVAVAHDNVAATDVPAQQRTISQVLETSPTKDTAAALRSYRAAAGGCSAPLTDKALDGTKVKVTPAPNPMNMGAEAMAFKVTLTSQYFNLTTDVQITAAGHNAMAVSTTGYNTEQRARIAAQAWKNLATRS